MSSCRSSTVVSSFYVWALKVRPPSMARLRVGALHREELFIFLRHRGLICEERRYRIADASSLGPLEATDELVGPRPRQREGHLFVLRAGEDPVAVARQDHLRFARSKRHDEMVGAIHTCCE